MGVVGLPLSLPRHLVDSGPIGLLPRRHSITITTVKLDERAGTFVYGEEVGADYVELTQTFARKSAGKPRLVEFTRREVRVRAGASREVGADATVFLSELPVAQRRVHEAMLQTYARAAPPRYFEDITDLQGPFADAEYRMAASDDQAIRALHTMRVNLFEKQKYLVAGFVTNSAGTFMTYDDDDGNEEATRWREANLRIADAKYAIGAVSKAQALRTALWQDKDLSRVYELSGTGRLKVKASANGPEHVVSLDVGKSAPNHMEIAIRQAMAGAGDKVDEYIGQPVALYAKRLFERHLYTAQERYRGRIPPVDESADPLDQAGENRDGQVDWPEKAAED